MKGVYLRVSPWSVIPIAETIMTDDLRKEGYSINKNPYITILPSVKSEVQFDLPKFEAPQKIECSGIGFDPDIENPKTVYLDVSNDMIIQLWRDELHRQISDSDLIEDMKRMRIPLIQRSDDGDLTPSIRDDLVVYMDDFKPPNSVIGIELSEKTPEYMREE